MSQNEKKKCFAKIIIFPDFSDLKIKDFNVTITFFEENLISQKIDQNKSIIPFQFFFFKIESLSLIFCVCNCIFILGKSPFWPSV